MLLAVRYNITVDNAMFSFKIFNPHHALHKIQTINIGCFGLFVFDVLKGQ
jgi:galactose-1-phosphate uridylyltransferase